MHQAPRTRRPYWIRFARRSLDSPLGTKVRHHEIPLAAEERRQRRVVRELLADEIRKLIPKRKSATPTERAKAKTVFANARRSLTASDIKELSKFGVKPTVFRVEKLNTPLHAQRRPTVDRG